LAKHRFSVDCDLVIPSKELKRVSKLLKDEHFQKLIEKKGFDGIYGGIFVSFVKKVKELPVNLDLLVNSLVCRATNASWSFRYIKKYSLIANIAGIESSVECRIPEKELLMAFKIHSGRRTDLRDIIMLREGADLDRVSKHLKRGNIKSLKSQIEKEIEMLEDPNLIPSLKGVFAIREDVTRNIDLARRDLNKLISSLKTFA
ncbi:MAG: hypothetical protein QXZ02_02875, partial [Candidatus Bathyarchaeia archaeon]